MRKNYFWITLIGLMVMAAGFVACHKCDKCDECDDKNPGVPDKKEMTYTFKFNADASGAIVNAIVYEYNNSEIVVGQQSFNCTKGLRRVVTANSKTTKVKVKIIVNSESFRWVMKVYYLEDGKNIDIEINDDTTLIPMEPIG